MRRSAATAKMTPSKQSAIRSRIRLRGSVTFLGAIIVPRRVTVLRSGKACRGNLAVLAVDDEQSRPD